MLALAEMMEGVTPFDVARLHAVQYTSGDVGMAGQYAMGASPAEIAAVAFNAAGRAVEVFVGSVRGYVSVEVLVPNPLLSWTSRQILDQMRERIDEVLKYALPMGVVCEVRVAWRNDPRALVNLL